MLRVGLTGGIGSGKSTAARRFAELGAVLVDSDVLAREVVAPGTEGLAEIVTAFGAGVLGPDGGLDRPALAAVVFGDPQARARLNAIVHPRVRDRTEELIARAPGDAVVVQDVPLLVETGSPRRSRWSWWCTPTRRTGCGGSWSRGAWRRRTPGRGSPRRPPTRRAAPRRTSCSTTGGRPQTCGRPSTRCGTTASCRSRTTCGTDDRCRPRRTRSTRSRGGRPTAPGSRPGSPGRPVRVRGTSRTSDRPPCPGCPRSTSWTSRSPSTPASSTSPGAVEAVRAGLDAAGFPRIGCRRRGGVAARGRRPGPAGAAGAATGRVAGVAGGPAVARLAAGGRRGPVGVPGPRSAEPRAGRGAAITRAEEWAASSGWTPSLEELPGP